jgi:hypothetical protein
MKQSHINKEQLSPYNLAVKQAHTNILKVAKQLLAQIEHEELRYTLVRGETHQTADGIIIHEFVNPLLYLRLECREDNLFTIRFGFEQITTDERLSNITASFMRGVYRFTAKDVTPINIEGSVKTDWCINNPSDMYAYIEDKDKHHTFQLIKHKVTASQRKRLLNVA